MDSFQITGEELSSLSPLCYRCSHCSGAALAVSPGSSVFITNITCAEECVTLPNPRVKCESFADRANAVLGKYGVENKDADNFTDLIETLNGLKDRLEDISSSVSSVSDCLSDIRDNVDSAECELDEINREIENIEDTYDEIKCELGCGE